MHAALLCFAFLLALVVIAQGSEIENDISKALEVKSEIVVLKPGNVDGNATSGSTLWSSGGKSGDVKWRKSEVGSKTLNVPSKGGEMAESVMIRKSSKVHTSGPKSGDKSGDVSWQGGNHSGSANWQRDGSGTVAWGGKGSGSGKWSKDGGFVHGKGFFVKWGEGGAGGDRWLAGKGGQ